MEFTVHYIHLSNRLFQFWWPRLKGHTFSNTALIRLRMPGIPRSASVIANGHIGKAGHAIAVKLRGSTYLGSWTWAILIKTRTIKKNETKLNKQNKSLAHQISTIISPEIHHLPTEQQNHSNSSGWKHETRNRDAKWVFLAYYARTLRIWMSTTIERFTRKLDCWNDTWLHP